MTAASQWRAGEWVGVGSTSVLPPADYWAYLAGEPPDPQVEELHRLSDERLGEFTPSDLHPPKYTAIALLERVAADGWLTRIQRRRCPNCNYELSEEQAAQTVCPDCGEAYSEHDGVQTEAIYARTLEPSRDVDWVVAIHGMNTSGAWQEAFSWRISTTWGQSVPVAVYKYGIVIAGVIMAWRRGKLRNELREKLATLRDEACAHGFSGKPDVIAHSFGTWLIGQLLEKELEKKPQDRLTFGRIILTGCILRPDFNWARLKEAELIDDVLNHYGTKDPIVPLAHAAIWGSGPSGRRGFDSNQVFNIRAVGYKHSDLFLIDKWVANGRPFQKRTGEAGEISHLDHSYIRYWRPFLTLPQKELGELPNRADPTIRWRPLPWPLRGTLFPFFVLPLTGALAVLFVAVAGKYLWEVRQIPSMVLRFSLGGLAGLLALIGVMWFWRRVWSLSRHTE